MKCRDFEKEIYVYRELSDSERQIVEAHIQTCAACQQVFDQVQRMNKIVSQSTVAAHHHTNPTGLTNKIISSIASKGAQPKSSFTMLSGFLQVASTRYALAGVSICLVFLFFIEVGNPNGGSKKMRGPIASLQGAILNSEDLRRNFTSRKKKKRSSLADCTKPSTNKIDLVCLKEKIKKLNF